MNRQNIGEIPLIDIEMEDVSHVQMLDRLMASIAQFQKETSSQVSDVRGIVSAFASGLDSDDDRRILSQAAERLYTGKLEHSAKEFIQDIVDGINDVAATYDIDKTRQDIATLKAEAKKNLGLGAILLDLDKRDSPKEYWEVLRDFESLITNLGIDVVCQNIRSGSIHASVAEKYLQEQGELSDELDIAHGDTIKEIKKALTSVGQDVSSLPGKMAA